MSEHSPLCHHRQPVVQHIVGNQIEEGKLYEASLCFPHYLLEVRSMLPIFLSDNLLPLPKLLQDTAHVWSIIVALQCCQEVAPVQIVL